MEEEKIVEETIIETDEEIIEELNDVADAETASTDGDNKKFFSKAKEKALHVIDANSDGKLDLKDVAHVAGIAGGAMKKTGSLMAKTASALKDTAAEKAKEKERKALMPIFEEDLDDTDFVLTKFVRVCNRDKKRAESEVCQGAIGYYTEQKDFKYVNAYIDKLELFGASFFPDSSYEIYYIDPADRDKYIALDDYFSYLKVARINELQKIAQDLGAKHFRVTYKEEKTSFSNKEVKGTTNIKTVGDAVYDIQSSAEKFDKIEIAAEMDCPGHDPIKPTLLYLQRDTSVQNLIAMRMDEHAPLTHQKLSIKLSNSSGIKERDAVKIDAVLKGLKLSGNTTVTSEARNESRRYLEYEIDF